MPVRLLLFLILIKIAGPCSVAAQADLAGKNVLILHSTESNMPLNVQTDRAIMRVLQAGGVGLKNQFYEYLDLHRNPGVKHRKGLADIMRLRYGDRKIDAIITLYPEALEFLLDEGRELFAEAPIVALYLFPDFVPPSAGRPIIQHVLRTDMVGTLECALKLAPSTKHVYVVGGSHPLDKKNEAQARQDFKKWEDQLDFHYLNNLSLDEMMAAVSSAPADTIIFYMAVSADSTGKTYNPRDVAERLSRASSAPVFGLYETLLGHGIVGGSLVSYEGIGTQAGQLALNFLGSGSDLHQALAVLDVPGVTKFDWQQLKRWGFDESALPTGSVVLNKPISVWDQYKYIILGVLIFILLESALLAVLFLQRRRKNIAEQALRESEERLDLATESAGVGIWIMHMDTGFIWVTDKQRELFRFAPDEELSFERFIEVIHPDDRESVRGSVRQSLEKRESLNVEYRILHPDGSIRWVVSSGRPHSEAPGQPMRLMGVTSDVTQRKMTELQLSESRTLLAALFDSTSDMIWSVDSERFGLLTFNRGLYEHFLKQRGIHIEVGMRPEDLFPTDDFVQTWRKFYRRALEEESFTTEYQAYKGTQTLLLNLNRLKRDDVVFGVSVFGRDITERKKAEEAVRESEAKYHSLYESMMDGYVMVGMDGRILKYNESYREMTGYTQDELLRLTYYDITPEKWHASENEIIKQQVLVRGYSDVYEKEYRKKDGTVFPVELRTFLLKDETGGNVGMWAIVRDYTGRKRIESEARKLREELAHVTRVSTLGELTSSLAHEINQPLAAILSNAQAARHILSHDKPDMKEVSEILGDIIRDDNRAAEVIRKIRSLLKKEETRYETLNLNDVIEEILYVIRNDTALAAVSIEKELDPSLPSIWGDRIQLQQVLLNLVLNSAEAMKEAGTDVRRLEVRTSKKDGLFAEVSIRDVGPGIEENIASRLFEPFYTTKPGGMGMGLAISKYIVKGHKGEIRAVNNPDGGATFSFTVPIDNGVKP